MNPILCIGLKAELELNQEGWLVAEGMGVDEELAVGLSLSGFLRNPR